MFPKSQLWYFILVLAKFGNAQRASVSGCIAGNVSLKFEPVIDTNRIVSSYTWDKDIGPLRDPSFAKYEGQTSRFQTYMDEIEGRIFHSPENPTDLNFTNLRISDAAKYTLVVRYEIFTGDSPEYIIDLSVEDVCFNESKEVGKCTMTTCFTGEKGILLTPNNSRISVNGFKEVKVCDDTERGNYSCCNADRKCETRMLSLPGNAQRASVSGCIAGNVTLKFKPAVEIYRTVGSYTWNKDIGPNRDPTFARYEGQTNRFQTFMEEINGRIFHSPENPSDLNFTNLRISDAAKYTLVVRYDIFTGDSPEFIVDLSVKDVCFNERKEVGKCTITTCFTGENGILLTPNNSRISVNGFKEVKVCDDTERGKYSCCNAVGNCETRMLSLPGNAQRASVSGCIAGNVTLKFEPVIDPNRIVSSYTWNKDIGPSRDSSFAKYEGQINRFQTIMEEIYGRIFHSPENPTDLILTNLRISDAAKYTLVVRYEEFTGDSPEFIVDLSVKDVCFNERKEVGKCTITTCFTGENGILLTPNNRRISVNGFKEVKVERGNYSCCNAVGNCETRMLSLPDVCFNERKEVGKCTITTCFTGENGILLTPNNSRISVNGFKEVKVCDDIESGKYSCCNAVGNCETRMLSLPGNAQRASVSGCIAGNVTLKFEPVIDPNRIVSSYTWNKDIGPSRDPSFAKYEGQINRFQTIMKEIYGRIFHSPENPTDLILTNLRIRDAAKYTLVVRYEEFTGDSPEFFVYLSVKDVCFNERKEVGKCTITTCFTGENGILLTPNNSRISVNGFKEVKVCYDIERGIYSCCNAVGNCETRMLSLPGNAQRASVSGCIAGNVTLKFEPVIETDRNVSSYTWNKDIGPSRDPSFAKYEDQTNRFQTFMEEIYGRIFHSPENPTDLILTNLRIRDAAKYTLVVRYVRFTGDSPEFIVDLSVKDVCFNERKEVGKCTITTCFTGENGILLTPNNSRISVNGFKEVKVCDDIERGNYSCCNAVGNCETRMLSLPGNAQRASVSGCIAGNVTLKFEPVIDPNINVSSYTWNKDIGPSRDPSFAWYEDQTNRFQTFMDEINGRIFHSPENPTDLHLTNLRISDAAKYTLVVRYVRFTGDSPEFIVDLSVKDVCFNERKEVGKCTITTCFTGENGILLTPNNSRISVNGFKEVKVCDDIERGNYSCCNAVGNCETRMLSLPAKPVITGGTESLTAATKPSMYCKYFYSAILNEHIG
ncbi:uncharacterized protein LOC111103877 isoform X3 [Crassostrea virginica]